jgi:GTP cyclohydrolase I
MDRAAAANAIDAFLRAIGRDAAQEPDLVGTGARVTDAFIDELCAGYAVEGKALVAQHAIDDGDGKGDVETGALVLVRDIPVVTTCPHHLLPAVGTADVALTPKARIVGLGAIAELVDAHARRLTLQEHIGERVVADLDDVLAPAWVACRILLSHGCMIARGSRPVGTKVETMALRRVDAVTVTTILAGRAAS